MRYSTAARVVLISCTAAAPCFGASGVIGTLNKGGSLLTAGSLGNTCWVICEGNSTRLGGLSLRSAGGVGSCGGTSKRDGGNGGSGSAGFATVCVMSGAGFTGVCALAVAGTNSRR